MKRHAFDPVSAFFGLVFLGSALAVTLVDERLFDLSGRWVWPGLVMLAGLLLVFSSLRRGAD